MRQFATGLNRAWLIVLGVVLLVAGLATMAIGTGIASRFVDASPGPDQPVLGTWVSTAFADTVAVLGLAVLGLVVALLALRWLSAQLPRTNAAAPLRLTDNPVTGLTVCAPSVLTDAVVADVLTLDGVTDADAVLRGTADAPELTLRITADDRTDVTTLLAEVRATAVEHLETALETPLARLAVQVDISPHRRTADRVSL